MAQFRYLGTTITNQNLIQEKVKRRLNSGNSRRVPWVATCSYDLCCLVYIRRRRQHRKLPITEWEDDWVAVIWKILAVHHCCECSFSVLQDTEEKDELQSKNFTSWPIIEPRISRIRNWNLNGSMMNLGIAGVILDGPWSCYFGIIDKLVERGKNLTTGILACESYLVS
jgi:hypothetical protein